MSETFDEAIARLQDDGNGAYAVKPYLHLVCANDSLEFAARCPRCFQWADVEERTARVLYDGGPAECQRCGEDMYLIANADHILGAVDTVREVERRLASVFGLPDGNNIPDLCPENVVSAWDLARADRLLREGFELAQAQSGTKPAVFRIPTVRLPHRYNDRHGEGDLRELSFGLATREASELSTRLLAAEGRQEIIDQRPAG